MSRRKRTEQRELWRQRIAQQMSSGQSVRAFCREHELGEHSFYQWRKRIGSGAAEPVRFALVETPPATTAASLPVHFELWLHGGERLLIPADAASLRLVFSALSQTE